jgi:hypothetical protein
LIFDINLTNSANFFGKNNSPIFGYHKIEKKNPSPNGLHPSNCKIWLQVIGTRGFHIACIHVIEKCEFEIPKHNVFLFQFCDVDKVMIILMKI